MSGFRGVIPSDVPGVSVPLIPYVPLDPAEIFQGQIAGKDLVCLTSAFRFGLDRGTITGSLPDSRRSYFSDS